MIDILFLNLELIKTPFMKNFLFTLLFISSINSLFAQDPEGALKLIYEGIELHDNGNFIGAIKKYDAALALDKDNFNALAEKANSYNSLNQFDKAIENAKKAIELYPDEADLNLVYVAYGNSLDGLKKSDESIEVYDEGISKFPEFYLLHFNKGITLVSLKEYDQALLCFQQAAKYNPSHPGSQNAIARFQKMNEKRVPAIMAYCRFFVLEPTGTRAAENLASLESVFLGDVTKTGKNSITINIGSDFLLTADSTEDGKPAPNTFTSTEMILVFSSAMDLEKENKKKNKAELFSMKLEMMCSSLSEQIDKGNSGFYWEYYAPYFIEMKNAGQLETFSYIVYASSGDKKVLAWIKEHSNEIEKFYDWDKEYNW